MPDRNRQGYNDQNGPDLPTEGEQRRDIFRRIEDLEGKAKSNYDTLHGNGSLESLQESHSWKIEKHEERIKCLEDLRTKVIVGICAAVSAAVIAFIKMGIGVAASLLKQ